MVNLFIYTGLTIMLIGALFGFFVAYKGYKETNWKEVNKISSRALFMRGPRTPQMKKLSNIWRIIMIIAFVVVGIGIAIGLH